jgi:hypothetical protein
MSNDPTRGSDNIRALGKVVPGVLEDRRPSARSFSPRENYPLAGGS